MEGQDKKRLGRFIEFILNYPRTIIAFTLLVTVLLGWNIPKIKLDPDIKSMMPKDMPVIQAIDRIEETFGGSELVMLSLTADDIFDLDVLEKIRALTNEIEQLEQVERVMSVTNIFEIKGTPEGFEVRDLITEFPQSASEKTALRQRIMANNMIYGNLVAQDFKRTAVIAVMKVGFGNVSDKRTTEIFEALKAKYENPEEIHLAGLPITRYAITHTMQTDMKALFPFGVVLMILLLVISFRSWLGAFLPFIVVIICIICTLGLMALLGFKFTFVSILMPVMLIAIANDYSIHLVAYYFEEYRRSGERDKRKLIGKMLTYLKTPVFLAAITTVFGFLSLQSHVLPPARQMGLLAGFGITLSLFLSFTLVPAAMQLLDFPVILKTEGQSPRIDRLFTRWGSFFIRHRRAYLMVGVILVVGIGTGIRKIVVDTNPMHYYRKDADIRISNDIIDKYFGGSAQLNVLANGDIQDPALLKQMDQISEYLLREPSVTRTTSIVDHLKKMNKAFHGDDPAYEVLPETKEAVAQYLLLFSMSGGEGELDQFVDYNYQQAQILARVNETSSMKLHKLLQDTRTYIRQNFTLGVFPDITGVVAVIGDLVDMVVRGQVRSMLISIVLVAGITALIFRSLVGGLIAVIPLTGAIVVVFGLMGFAGIELNVVTAMLSSIMIGVGIDYTIHFIYRFRYEIQHGATAEEAVINTLTTSGKGIIYNALSVVIGFTVLLISGFLPIYFFGFLIVFSISACLVGALTIMPAFLVSFKPKFIFRNKSTD